MLTRIVRRNFGNPSLGFPELLREKLRSRRRRSSAYGLLRLRQPLRKMKKLLSEQTPRVMSVILNKGVFEDDETGERRSPPFAPNPPSKDRTTEEDPKPPRSDRDVIEEVLRIHDNLEVFLRGNSMDGKMKEVFRAEKYSLESEIEGYSTCPDALLSGKITAIEARIQKFKDLSSAMVKEDRAVRFGFSENEVKAEASNGE
ncbi:hypothetical protein U1Q18_014522, partial [Sarracenia purpurea var. burkii]